MIQFRCPHCKEAMSVPDSLAGQVEECPGCESSVIVPSQAMKPVVWGRYVSLFLFVLILAMGTLLILKYQSKAPANELQPVIVADTVSITEPRKGLTLFDVTRVADQLGMKVIVSDESDCFTNWESEDGLFVRCIWFSDSKNKVVQEIFVAVTGVEHGPEGQLPVLKFWRQLSPQLALKFEALFSRFSGLTSPLQWIDNSSYAYGVSANNKAFIKYIGPQREIELRRKYALVTAKLRISWYRYIESSQKKLVAKIERLSHAQAQKIIVEEMNRLDSEFSSIPSSTGFDVDHYVILETMSHMSPEWIPDFLPVETQIKLQQTAATIALAARIAKFNAKRIGGLDFKPYHHMYMAFSTYSGVERSALGKYGRVAGMNVLSKLLPQKQCDALEEIGFKGLAYLNDIMGE